MLEGQGRLVTEVGTVLEKPGTLTTGTTVLQGAMMLLTTGATVLEWPGAFFLFLCIMESQMKPLMHSAICDFVIKSAVILYTVSLKTGKVVQADLNRENGAERLRKGKCYPSRFLCHLWVYEINGDNQVQLQSRLQYWQVHM